MARLLHVLISIGVCGLLGACERAPASATASAAPEAQAQATETPKPTPVVLTEQQQAGPDWKSRVPAIEAGQVVATLHQADEALARGQLDRGRSPGPGALELYLAVLAVDPANVRAQVGVQSCLDALLEQGRLAARAGRFGEAERVVRIADALLPRHPDLQVYREHVSGARQAAKWVDKAKSAAAAGRFTDPAGDSALDYFRQATQVYPDFEPARSERSRWNEVLLEQAWKAAKSDDYRLAEQKLMQSERLLPRSAQARVTGLRVIELRQARTDDLLARGNEAVDRLRLDRADALLAQAQAVAAQPYGVEALRERIHIARHYGPFKPAQVFAEELSSGVPGPEMVVVPFGSFTMGSSEDDAQGQASEMPAHEVRFERGFAISRNEVTVAEFRRFVDAAKYRTRATRNGRSTVYDEKGGVFSEHEGVDWSRDHVGRIASPSLPVVHVAWADAVAYTRWLSSQTGKTYRLPSEAEFEYVLRAGGNTVYPWGDGMPPRIVGNLTGDGDLSRTGRTWSNAIADYRDAFWGPAPVRNFPEEPFGTFDTIGNVSEWTLDCWHESYQRAPVDGSAWVNPGCPQRVARGASWGSALVQARSASRLPMVEGSTNARLGFRVVREL
jgi:formylglycine-generating enzyme required for sulfatase activity